MNVRCLQFELMMEMARRSQPDRTWWKPSTADLAGEAWRQAGYCLDAPEDIPAGGMYSDEMAGEALPMPMTVDRETPNVELTGQGGA